MKRQIASNKTKEKTKQHRGLINFFEEIFLELKLSLFFATKKQRVFRTISSNFKSSTFRESPLAATQYTRMLFELVNSEEF